MGLEISLGRIDPADGPYGAGSTGTLAEAHTAGSAAGLIRSESTPSGFTFARSTGS